MRLALLCTPYSVHTCRWVGDELARRGHLVDVLPAPVDGADHAVRAGNSLAERWLTDPPDLVLALGWQAGLTARVAARTAPVAVALRLSQAARRPGSDRARLEAALARGSALVLVPSAGELDHLVECGVPRSTLRLLPEAVDPREFADTISAVGAGGTGGEVPVAGVHRVAVARPSDGSDRSGLLSLLRALPACDPVLLPADPSDVARLPAALRAVDVVVATDDSDGEVALVLQGMSCGAPTVAVDAGTLSDVVAHGVTGLLTPSPAGVTETLRSLLSDPMRRQSMGLASVDRVRARFATTVVGAALERMLLELAPRPEPVGVS